MTFVMIDALRKNDKRYKKTILKRQGSHRNSKTQFHDFSMFSMINNVISMTI